MAPPTEENDRTKASVAAKQFMIKQIAAGREIRPASDGAEIAARWIRDPLKSETALEAQNLCLETKPIFGSCDKRFDERSYSVR
ncbi:MAG: hypothetical protein M3Q19_16025 [Pseudomonadota bacterium]|nr:hypothetical protein [Pseudomonadota bacterium]